MSLATQKMQVPFSYLARQFENVDDYLQDIREVVLKGDFTLGAALSEFEEKFAASLGMPYAIGVGSGTDAIAMSLKMLGVGAGDEVITCANTFVATAGAIVMTGATIVFVDSENGYVMDVDQLKRAITPKTKAIVPVHYTGNMADMKHIHALAEEHGLVVVEDACQAYLGAVDGKCSGTWSDAAAFSLHPLKNLNVWSDGGVIVTRSLELAEKLRLYRNHGLKNRDEIVSVGINSRLDTVQAAIGNRLIQSVERMTERRIAIAHRYDAAFNDLKEFIDVPVRRGDVRHVFHLYVLRVKKRDALKRFLVSEGVEAKIHYPKPLHLQEAFEDLGYKKGDFPMTEAHSDDAITLPAHPYLSDEEVQYTMEKAKEFYGKA